MPGDGRGARAVHLRSSDRGAFNGSAGVSAVPAARCVREIPQRMEARSRCRFLPGTRRRSANARGPTRNRAVREFCSSLPGCPPSDDLSSLRARARRKCVRPRSRQSSAQRRADRRGGLRAQPYLASADRTVIGADLTAASLELAARASRRFAVHRAFFVETDLAAGLREQASTSSIVRRLAPHPTRGCCRAGEAGETRRCHRVGALQPLGTAPPSSRRGLAPDGRI